jgi:hypothetical protein
LRGLLLRLAPVVIVFGVILYVNLSGGGNPASARLAGAEQTVFRWSRDACEPIDIPDAPARAFRGAGGSVTMIAASYINRRFTGPDLDHLRHPCKVVMNSQYNPDPAAYTDRSWIAATYTPDGRSVFALVHDEYQGNTHPGRCAAAQYLPCWFNSITYAASTDGGRTFVQPPVPQRVVATVPYQYEPGAGPYGLFQPSNIVFDRSDGYYYSLIRAEHHRNQPAAVCVMRTHDPARSDSWRAWNGHDFTVQFVDPYVTPPQDPAAHVCRAVDGDVRGMTQSLTYNTYFRKYMLVGTSTIGHGRGAILFSLSDDLVHWSAARLIETIELVYTYDCGDENPVAHPSILDPRSSSRNFETAAREPYLDFTRFHYQGCQQTLDRDLVRVRIRFSK